MIIINFEYIKDDIHKFNDAIVLEDNHNLTDEQIEEIKKNRINNWLKENNIL